MEVVANNIANANSTSSAEGGPYRRKQLVFAAAMDDANLDGGSATAGAAAGLNGVRVIGIEADTSEFPQVFMPGHPNSDENGMVEMPNVSIPNEMIDLLTASRSYEANLRAINLFKDMVEQTLTILRGNR
jgi:flagellar basal-body rod protein FlgC